MVLAAVLFVALVATLILPEVAVEAVLVPMVLTGLAALAEPLSAAALVAETVLLLDLEPAAAVEALLLPMTLAELAVLAEPLIVAVLSLVAAAALVVEAVLVVELEPVAAVVAAPLVLAVQVGVVLAMAPVLALVIVECWRSELPLVVGCSRVAAQ